MGNSPSTEETQVVNETYDEESAASVIQKSWRTKGQEPGFKWPANLYVELLDMAETDKLVDYVALLFKAARGFAVKGMPVVPESAQEEKPKLTLAQIQSILESNADDFKKSGLVNVNETTEFFNRIAHGTSARKLSFVGLDYESLKTDDLEYCIVKDDKLKRITIVFPTTNSKLSSDWILKRAFPQKESKLVRGLVAKVSGDRVDAVNLHQGFSDYLNKKNGDEVLGNKIFDDVFSLLTPKHKLYVTGHGMGAALAAIFAFKMAFDSDIPLPVTCINFGCPRIGDAKFQRACNLLEISGKLRFCRVVTETDTLPTTPAKADYVHAGYLMRLGEGTAQEYYPTVDADGSPRKGAFASTKKFTSSQSDQVAYLESIEKNSNTLKMMDLNKLYSVMRM